VLLMNRRIHTRKYKECPQRHSSPLILIYGVFDNTTQYSRVDTSMNT
jgi:hypothetical protein